MRHIEWVPNFVLTISIVRISQNLWTYQSGTPEWVSIKRLRDSLRLAKMFVCLMSVWVVFHIFTPRNVRVFSHFDFEYRRATIYNLLWILLHGHVQVHGNHFFIKVLMFTFINNLKILHRVKKSYTPLNWINQWL